MPHIQTICIKKKKEGQSSKVELTRGKLMQKYNANWGRQIQLIDMQPSLTYILLSRCFQWSFIVSQTNLSSHVFVRAPLCVCLAGARAHTQTQAAAHNHTPTLMT